MFPVFECPVFRSPSVFGLAKRDSFFFRKKSRSCLPLTDIVNWITPITMMAMTTLQHDSTVTRQHCNMTLLEHHGISSFLKQKHVSQQAKKTELSPLKNIVAWFAKKSLRDCPQNGPRTKRNSISLKKHSKYISLLFCIINLLSHEENKPLHRSRAT